MLCSYNVYNAYVKSFGYPLAIAAIQLGVGLLYAIPLWILGVRKMPNVNLNDLLLLLPIGKMCYQLCVLVQIISGIINVTIHLQHY